MELPFPAHSFIRRRPARRWWRPVWVMGLMLLAMLGAPASAPGQTPEEVLLNLESIKLEMERIRQETTRLGLLTQAEIQRELDLLRLEMERAKLEFEQELLRFQRIAEKENYETLQVVEKFKLAVNKLFQEIQERLIRQQAENLRLHAEAKGAAETSVEKFDADQLNTEVVRARVASAPALPRPVKPEPRLVLPRIKTLSPDQPLELDSVEREGPRLRDLKAKEDLKKDVTYDPKFYYVPKPGVEPPAKDAELKRHVKALQEFSAQIETVKAELRQAPDDPRPLWLNLGDAYLGSERYLQSVSQETTGKIFKSDMVSSLILGGYQAALLAFKTALWLNPDDPETNLTVSAIYDELEDGQNAVNYLERARVLYRDQKKDVQAKAAAIKLNSLIAKYPKIWICPPGQTNECEQNAGRQATGAELFESNLAFSQSGIPPKPAP